ncbi:lipoyl synthase [Carboxydochorda subterranea]|uniref:Lipoyl synthase n=1 Tax=Carboxydichorda subterranea TaxID=3109565 RepID=A0ABZ1BWS6_9FIRM|nr:lipoyl synthase [Limnochorda sp. L945t]WRP17237.1 lipoyl synthase [Limnochorda sp. L945t]
MVTEIKAVRGGLRKRPTDGPGTATARPKPEWLKVPLPVGPVYARVSGLVRELGLHTVCQEARCPNVAECWGHGTATFMILGWVCTRACKFCAVATGNPRGAVDAGEPQRVATAVRELDLEYVVLTSVDRDDLPDGGAAHFARTVRAIKEAAPSTRVEALTPDFRGDRAAVALVVDSGLDVFAHNLETVRRLTPRVRDPRATYDQSLEVLAFGKRHRPEVLTKSSLMLGLGETDGEIREAMRDLRAAGVDILTLGQYLRPSKSHLSVERYVTPAEFLRYRDWGYEEGFVEVFSGPLVRSSYRADRVFEEAKAGQPAGAGAGGVAASRPD